MDSENPITNSVQNVDVATASEGLTARYEHSNRKLTEELSLKEIVKIFTSNWLLFVAIFTAMSVSAVAIYIFRIPYVATGSIVVNDSQNSQLQSFSSQIFGLAKVAESKRNNSPLQKHLEFLKTEEFYKQLVIDIQAQGQSEALTVAEKKGFQNLKSQIIASRKSPEKFNEFLQMLDSKMKIKLASDFEIKVTFSSSEKETALFLTNIALQTIVTGLRDRELLEIIKVEAFLKGQKEQAEKNLTDLNKQLAEFQNKPENLITLSSKEKVGDYLSELMVRKNEIRMKIAENQKVADYLSQGQSKRRESQLYGNGGRIQALMIENEMNRSKLNDLQRAIDTVTSQAKTIPVTTQIFEELKKKSEIEFAKYKDNSDSLTKIEAQKLSINSRFEILVKSRLEKVVPLVSLVVLLMLAFVVAQILGSLVIYVMYIWDSNAVTAHSSRDIVILDSHSLDPRVIIENTKIRFRLRNIDDIGEAAEENSQRKISFNIFDKKSSGESFDS